MEKDGQKGRRLNEILSPLRKIKRNIKYRIHEET